MGCQRQPGLTAVNHNIYTWYKDSNIGKLAAGNHTFRLVVDADGQVAESDETDNEYTRTFTVSTCKNLTPYQPASWDNKIVLSTVTGTNTSATTIYDNQPVYLEWAVVHDGSIHITETFTVKLYVDAVLKNTWTKTGLNVGGYLYDSDYALVTLSAGSHTFKIVADADNAVAETNEGDNEYSRTITVLSSILPAPVATAATGTTQTGFSANWNASAGATGYYLDVSTSNTFASFVSGYNNKNVGNVLTSAVAGLTACQTYYYRVRAYNAGGTSNSSNTITVVYSNHAPTIANKIPDQQVYAGQTITIAVSPVIGQNFNGTDPGDILTISATMENGSNLPSYITHTSGNLIVSPMLADIGCINIMIKATDLCSASITDVFKLCVADMNTAIAAYDKNPVTIQLYPNPTTGKVKIESDAGYGEMSLSVFNVLGTKLLSVTYYAGEQITFDLSGFPPGDIYCQNQN